MPLNSGERIGSYEIVSQLGAGGMGEVYRARDSKLKREVAIKVLPADVADDRERLARFQREAEVLASLNHPLIAHVYGFEELSGPAEAGHHRGLLIMELVEGEDLSTLIASGTGSREPGTGLPIDEALSIAKQIAEALEAAHDAGIIHRDLKPGNIKVKDDGTVKVLDFGLAKAMESGTGTREPGADLANSPTITSPAMTMRGVILGTAAYMSPEQAKGKVVDKRADIWAFGCVLYEMLTGTRAFKGDDVTDIITSVMRDTPDWNALPADTPASIRVLLRRCLERDPRRRAPHISIARLAIEDASTPTGELVSGARPERPRSPWQPALAVSALTAIVASALTFTLTRRDEPVTPAGTNSFRYSISVPVRTSNAGVAVSPDGRYVALAGRDASGNRHIWIRPLDGSEFTRLDGATGADFPFWSPDSREIGFFSNRRLMRIGVEGGAAREIANVEPLYANVNADGGAAAWGADGTILFGAVGRAYRVSANGGPAEPMTGEPKPGEPAFGVGWPQWMPGQTGFLFTKLRVVSVRTEGALTYQPLPGGNAVDLTDVRARSQVTAEGLLVARGEMVRAPELRLHQFDAATGRLDQPGRLVTADASLEFAASSNGVLVYRGGASGAPYRFEWVNSAGQSAGDSFDTIETGPFNLSKDETQLAFMERGSVVVRDLTRGVSTTLVEGRGVEPIFSPDGSRIAYGVVDAQHTLVYIQPSSGGNAEKIYESPQSTLTEDWSSDGKYIALNEGGRRGFIIAVDGKEPPVTYGEVQPGGGIDEPRFSPDGRWLVYNAAHTAQQEVFLIPLPPTGERYQVSVAGGSQGRWRRDGKALYYMAANGDLMSVDVQLTPGRRPGLSRPRLLFNTGLIPTSNIDQYAPNRDGTRFLLRRPRGNDGLDRLEVIVNWPALIKAEGR